jgi:hypothetical protein
VQDTKESAWSQKAGDIFERMLCLTGIDLSYYLASNAIYANLGPCGSFFRYFPVSFAAFGWPLPVYYVVDMFGI